MKTCNASQLHATAKVVSLKEHEKAVRKARHELIESLVTMPKGFNPKKEKLLNQNGSVVAAEFNGMIHVDDHGVPKAVLLAWLLRGYK